MLNQAKEEKMIIPLSSVTPVKHKGKRILVNSSVRVEKMWFKVIDSIVFEGEHVLTGM
jgi:hypothetical protein